MQITQLIASLATVGGLGFINYYIATQMDVIDFKGKDEKLIIPCMLCFSIFDYIIYLCVHAILIYTKFNSNFIIALSLLLTIIFTIIIAAYFTKPLFKLINILINHVRKNHQQSKIANDDIWNYLLKDDRETKCYIYDFNKNLIANGWIQISNKNSEHLAVSLNPFVNNLNKEELDKIISNQDFYDHNDIYQYVNTDAKLLIYLIKDRKD